MAYEIETKDGIVIRGIPDDVPADHPSVKAKVSAARARLANQGFKDFNERGATGGELMAAGIDPTEGNTFLQNAAIGAGKALTSTGRGIRQVGAEITGDTARADELRAQADEHQRYDQPVSNTGGGLVGEIAGHLAAAAAPGTALRLVGGAAKAAGAARAGTALADAGTATIVPKTIRGGAAAGAVQGAAQEVGTGDSRTLNAATGAGASAVGTALTRGASRVISPNVRPEVRALMHEGVTPTPGQILGGRAQAFEDKMTSVPIVGDAIAGAQGRGLIEFNRAVMNRALEPIGEALPPKVKGREALAHVQSKLGEAYDALLPKLKGDLNAGAPANALPGAVGQAARPSLSDELSVIRQMGANLPRQQMKDLNRIIDQEVIGKFTSSGKASGQTLKDIQETLRREEMEFRTGGPYERKLAGAIKEVNASVRRMIEDVNPGYGAELQAINDGYARFKRVQRAFASVGLKDDAFTSAQLHSAVKAGDKSKDHARFAAGNALMQDISEAGRSVLAPKYPDSGTAGRALGALAMGGVAGGAGLAFSNPAIPLAVMAGAGAYTAPLQKAMAILLTKRPDAAVPASALVKSSAPAIALAAREYLNAKQ